MNGLFMDEKTKMIMIGFLWFIFWTGLIFIGSWLFVSISSFTGIANETFLWLTSTIAQAFGAILGIFIAVAIFRQGKIEDLELQRRLLPPIPSIPNVNPNDEENNNDEGDEEDEEWIGLWPILYLPTQCMLVLIASAIVCLTLTDFFSARWISIASIFLMFYSLFCLGLLVYRIPKFFS